MSFVQKKIYILKVLTFMESHLALIMNEKNHYVKCGLDTETGHLSRTTHLDTTTQNSVELPTVKYVLIQISFKIIFIYNTRLYKV